MDAWISLQVKRREQLTPGLVMLELVAQTGHTLPRFTAGSYIDIQIPGGILRPYSLCNAPHDTDRYVIAVRREQKSRGASAYLHDRLKVGDALTIRHPRNEFPLHPSATHSMLLGGGVGVAPLLSMAEELWHRGASFELHVSAKNRQSVPFADYFRSASYRSRVHMHLSDHEGGRLDFDHVIKRVSPLGHLYLCGPAGYLQAGVRAALNAGISNERLHIEHFD